MYKHQNDRTAALMELTPVYFQTCETILVLMNINILFSKQEKFQPEQYTLI